MKSSGWAFSGLAVVFSVLTIGSAVAETTQARRFCFVPVIDGAPTDADVNQSWRMLSRVVILPGLSRPIIYPLNRGGVWTIDENRRFARFGGTFPANALFDQYAVDAESGAIAAIGRNGLFTIKPGETSFTAVAPNNGHSLQHTFSVAFIDRWKRFVVTDSAGAFVWAPSRPLEPLAGPDTSKLTGAVFDLPSIAALLMSARGAKENEEAAVLRYDDGHIETVVELGQSDFIVGGEVSVEGRDLTVRTYRETITLRRAESGRYEKISTENDKVNPIARPFEPVHTSGIQSSFSRLRTGQALFADILGLHMIVDGKAKRIPLPFDDKRTPVRYSMEMPASRALILFTSQTAYAVDDTGRVEEVEGAEQLANGRLPPAQGVLPQRNEMLVLGPKALHLLIDKKLSGEQACRMG